MEETIKKKEGSKLIDKDPCDYILEFSTTDVMPSWAKEIGI